MLFDITFTQDSKTLQAFSVPDTDLKLSHGDCGIPVSYCGNPVTEHKASVKRVIPKYFDNYGTSCE